MFTRGVTKVRVSDAQSGAGHNQGWAFPVCVCLVSTQVLHCVVTLIVTVVTINTVIALFYVTGLYLVSFYCCVVLYVLYMFCGIVLYFLLCCLVLLYIVLSGFLVIFM